jgi:NTP pyrophosphatase (non-canonical NTP hydrolase)
VSRGGALELVLEERRRQDARWGRAFDRRLPAGSWLAVLGEEVGEVAKALLETAGADAGAAASFSIATARADEHDLVGELVQVAAVALGWLESIAGEACSRRSAQELHRSGLEWALEEHDRIESEAAA